MSAQIGNKTQTSVSTSPATVSFNNNGSVLAAFVARYGTWTASNFKYNGQAMTIVEQCTHGSPGLYLTIYALALENAPEGNHDFTFNNAGGTWYVVLYSIQGGTDIGNSAIGNVAQGYNVQAAISTRDNLGIVLNGTERETGGGAGLNPNNMTEDYDFGDGTNRYGFGHVAATGGTDNPYFSWGTTEDAVCIVFEVHGAVGGSQAIWFWMERARRFYDELRRGLIPLHDLERRYQEVMI